MKIRETQIVPESEIVKFIRSHQNMSLVVEECLPSSFRVSYMEEYTVPEFHMKNLRGLVDKVASDSAETPLVWLTPEEQDAIEYAISAIKTLVDMGILSNTEDEK